MGHGIPVDFFREFADDRVPVGDVTLRVRHGGSGPPVLLLHGHPRTAATWHRVAPLLVAAGYTVICPDLRGYGASSVPPTTHDHAPYSKRAMAADLVGLLDHLGLRRAAVVGHDRGSYVVFRTAMDAPERVSRLAVLDGVPIGEALARCDARFAAEWWHWFFLARPEIPERVILADPDAWYRGSAGQMGPEAHAEFRRAVHDPATVGAMLEDYWAGLGVDRAHDDADRDAGRRIGCPTLVLWSSRDDMERLYGDPRAVWRAWADDVSGGPVDSGHHMAEEAPRELAARLCEFLRE
ncbi:alpha/beta fold hydrolase [Pseudonocardia sp. HH130630-07]|uniref:alpha/beta fold hydrolase n=1 Tax=Pseudonocardia sp. HH130630-07 TaxID=1690815 RepID=UPI000814E9BA|nr:alpha/beta hydrolase [Pseudonocardia sp. HH130630-07]ANY06594.1 alpha/beta hydrolase [Pseudonocardia sp. HH130630-07]